MINITKKLFYILTLSLIITFLLSGCKKGNEDVILIINDKELTIDDFRYDICLVETEGNKLDEYYKSNFGYGYWDFEYEGTHMRETAKDAVLSRVLINEILSCQATKEGILLSDQEILDNEKAVDNFLSNNKIEQKSGLTRSILCNTFNKILLSDKYYLTLSEEFDIDETAIRNSISPDNYIEYKTECIYIKTVNEKDKSILPLGIDELEVAYNIMSLALDKIRNGADFSQIKNEYKNLEYDNRNFIMTDTIAETQYKEAAMVLKNGEYSNIISTNYAYYIIHMIDNNSDNRLSDYEDAVTQAIRIEENKHFEPIYNTIKENYDITIQHKNWDTIIIGSTN